MERPILKQQEIPYDSPESNNHFGTDKPFVATPSAIEMYSQETIIGCLRLLQAEAERNDGLDYLQVFDDPERAESLWFIEDGAGGAVTALLPSDY